MPCTHKQKAHGPLIFVNKPWKNLLRRRFDREGVLRSVRSKYEISVFFRALRFAGSGGPLAQTVHELEPFNPSGGSVGWGSGFRIEISSSSICIIMFASHSLMTTYFLFDRMSANLTG